MRLIALALGLALGAGCGTDATPPTSPPTLPPDMQWLETSAAPLQWRDAGYLELTTPIRPPTTADETARIVVWLQVPPGATIDHEGMPSGTRAARVEYAGPRGQPDAPVTASWRVLDVRAFEWRDGTQHCSVLRPGHAERLVGVAWPCSVANDARAADVLGQLLREGRMAPRSEAARARAATHLAKINACTQCHVPGRAEDRHPGVLVQRGTDAAGLFTLASVFRAEDVAERYRPVDSNRGDPLISPRCPGSTLAADGARCQDGLLPRHALDIPTGLARRDPHVLRVCAARRALAARLAQPPPATLTGALGACKPE